VIVGIKQKKDKKKEICYSGTRGLEYTYIVVIVGIKQKGDLSLIDFVRNTHVLICGYLELARVQLSNLCANSQKQKSRKKSGARSCAAFESVQKFSK
jgi:hypothetical protein